MNARKKLVCEYTGKSAHAGGNPWDGVNALDALISSYNNVSVLRQQLLPDERIHCAFLDTPKVANVIPSSTQAFWQARSPTMKGLNRLVGRVRDCIEAGALATGCQVLVREYVCSSAALSYPGANSTRPGRSCTPTSGSTKPYVSDTRCTCRPTTGASAKTMSRS